MERWLRASLLAAFCVGALDSQTGGRVTGRIIGQGAGPVRGEVLVVAGGSSVRLNPIFTDAQGFFAMDLSAGQALLVARADGYVSEERQILVHSGLGTGAVQFTLSPAGQVSGRVFDETGAGVPAATVWVQYLNETRSWRLAEEAGGESADAFGYFKIPVVAQSRPFVLHAEADGRLPSASGTLVLLGRTMPGVVLMLSRRGTSIRGRVVDADGNPIAGAAVRLRVIPAESEFTAQQRASFAFARSTNKSMMSLADGSYQFDGVPVGRVVVTAEAGGRRSAAEAEVSPGREIEIALPLR
jgi:hypothetical protein